MLSSADAILALVGITFLALVGGVSSFPSSPVYGRLQRNAVSYPEGRYPHSDSNYYALLRGDVPLGGPASSPDWGQFLPAPWSGADAYNGGAGPMVVPAVVPQYDDYADEYDASSSAGAVQFPSSSNLGYDWYEAQGQPQPPQQLEQQELQEAAVFKDLLANYLSKKSNNAAIPAASDAEKRSETAKKYTVAGAARSTSTTARPNVAVLTAPRGKGAAASAQVALSSSTAAPQLAASSSSSSSLTGAAAEAFSVPVSQEGGQKEYAMFRPVGTAESRRPTFWRGGAKQVNSGAAAAHGKATRSRFGRFADDTLTEELDQLKTQ